MRCGHLVLKSLLVNLSIDRREELKELVMAIEKFSECRSMKFREIDADYEVGKDIDAVILSGSKARIVDEQQRKEFKHVTDLIKRLDLPLLSICYGHQLLCTSFGCEVEALAQPVIDKFEEVHIVNDDEIFSGFKADQTKLFFFQSHNDKVKRNSLNTAGFVLLADSRTCEVEAVRHKNKSFYGVQFHPERINIESDIRPDGHKLIKNFYKNVVKRK
jgi:GMP synthase-like glutamine amidotransferase